MLEKLKGKYVFLMLFNSQNYKHYKLKKYISKYRKVDNYEFYISTNICIFFIFVPII